jgi:hypothetical protein
MVRDEAASDEATEMINHIGVTTVERGDGNYDSTGLLLYIRQLL